MSTTLADFPEARRTSPGRATHGRTALASLLALACLFTTLPTARARQPQQQQQRSQPARQSAILINNVRIFDGIADELRQGNLLVVGNKISQISTATIAAPPGGTIIDGGGRVLMPGLTDAHWHMTFAPNTMANMDAADTGLMYANAVAEAERTLLRSFTTIRDTGGPTFGLKQAIDSGVIPGPPVYPSGALISQTSGHGDFAAASAKPKILGGDASHYEGIGAFTVADSAPQVMGAVREQLKRGASQIKISAGGGIISDSDPVDSLQYTPEEMRAAVQAANDWGTYVAAQVYTPAGIRRALEAGALSIEHGHLADEATVRLMTDKGAWLSIQTFEPGDNPLSPEQFEKAKPMIGAWQRVLRWAKRYNTKVAFGTDLLFDPEGTKNQNVLLTRLAQIYSPVEVLKIATSGNCELFARSGERNPYKEARLGVLQPGAWADMLLVESDPTRDINVLRDFERNFVVIIKDGKVYKNTLN